MISLGVVVLAAALEQAPRPADTKRVAEEMSGAAGAWLATLDEQQRRRALAALDDEQRFRWTPVPVEDRAGMPLKAMTEPQRAAATRLLRAALSQRGQLTVEAIMELETVLREQEGERRFRGGDFVRDPGFYNYVIYGDPASKSWAWRFEGHHVSLHTTVVNGQVAMAPVFLGSNPMEVLSGAKKGKLTLRERQDAGFEVLNSLRPEHRAQAVISEQVFDILQRDPRRAEPLEPKGLCICKMDAPQRARVRRLLEEYLGTLRNELARKRLATIERDGFDALYFAWAGALQPGRGHYYRLQGKSFLLEYDNSQNNANHIHTVWREFEGDFGRDLLREHYQRSHQRPGTRGSATDLALR